MSSAEQFDEIKKYLPRYLSDDEQRNLFEGLKQFPDNMDDRLFARALLNEPHAFQGDAITDLNVIQLPDTSVRPAPCMIISNTCDISPDNERLMPAMVVYAPIIRLSRYEILLNESHRNASHKISSYLMDVRKQRVSHIFYLPKGEGLEYEGMVMLDRLNNSPLEDLNNENLRNRRLFTLSAFGHYLFLFKLSIHFTRIRENIQRG